MRGEFERALELQPALVEAHEGLVGYYLQAPRIAGGSVDKAKAEIAEITRLNPMRGHIDAAGMFVLQKDTVAAEREFRAAVDAAPTDSAAAAVALGQLYVNEKRWNDALAVYNDGISKNPRSMDLRRSYGHAAAVSGKNLDRGEQELKLWLSSMAEVTTPSAVADAHCDLGEIYRQQSRTPQARAELEAAIALVPGHPAAKRALDNLRGDR
jgi:tetratricopeptide (TPR) repeat protein